MDYFHDNGVPFQSESEQNVGHNNNDDDDFVLLISWIAFDNNDDGSVGCFQLLDPISKESWSLLHNEPPLRGYATTQALVINSDEPYFDMDHKYNNHQHQQQWLVLGRGFTGDVNEGL
jgi:hypothetical protein